MNHSVSLLQVCYGRTQFWCTPRRNGAHKRARVRAVPEYKIERKEALRSVDRQLQMGNDSEALHIVSSLQGQIGGLRGFGAASQVPQRLYSVDELRLNKIETSKLLSERDSTLDTVRRSLQLSIAVVSLVAWKVLVLNSLQLLSIVLLYLSVGAIDLIIYNGGIEALVVDTMGQFLSKKYRERVAHHEAGHFLVAYLLGVLPKEYTLSSLETFMKNKSLNIQAGTNFIDFEFQEEVKSGKLSSKMLGKYSCIALAGVASEYLYYGFAEGGLADISQLDNLLKGLNFSQKKADSQVRWAVLNTVIMLRRHEQVKSKLVEAMTSKKSVGECIDIIENELDVASDI